MNKSLKRSESVPQGDNPPYRAGAGGRTRQLILRNAGPGEEE